MRSNPSITREPAGTPAGGRFAAGTTSEADNIDLEAWGEDFDDEEPPEGYRVGTDGTDLPDAAEAAAHFGAERHELAVAQSLRAAEWFGRRYGVDSNELQGEVLMSYYTTVESRNNTDEDTPATGLPATSDQQADYLWVATRNRAKQMSTGFTSGRDVAGFKKFDKARALFQQKFERTMTAEEEDILANEVRETFPAGERPKRGFHRKPVKELATELGEEGHRDVGDARHTLRVGEVYDALRREEALRNSRSASISHTTSPGDESMERVEALLDEPGQGARAEAIRELWGAFADRHGAPRTLENTAPPGRVTAVRKKVTDAGGASALVGRYASGELSKAESEALFAPWGGDAVSEDDKELVIEVLSRHRSNIDNLWSAAATAWTARRDRSVDAKKTTKVPAQR